MGRVLGLFAIGVAIGALTGVPIGPVNVAVIDASYRHTLRRALAVGLGGAIADFVYATLGIVGIGPYLLAYPILPRILYGVSGVVLIGYGAITVRTRPVSAVAAHAPRSPTPAGRPAVTAGLPGSMTRGDVWSGLTIGLALILLNPAALVTWVVIVGSHLAGVGTESGLAASSGIFVGSFAWFALVAYLTNHGKRVLGDKAVWIPRTVGALLVGYGIYSLGRAVWS
jgi:arginine exporter protein ArgO